MGAGINGGSLILAISPAGTIAYAPGFDRQADVVLLDRSGKERVVVPAGSYFMPRLSPHGRQIVLTVATGTDSDVWIHDIQRGATTKLTSGGRNLWPLWSPDGTRVAYASSREGSTNVYWRRADGSGAEEQLTSSAYTVIPQSWTRDGRYLVVTNVQPDRPNYVALMPTEGPHTIQRFETGDAPSTMGSLSADGRWMAYVSAESGRLEVYVRPYPGPGPALQISTAGGDEPSLGRPRARVGFSPGRDALLRQPDQLGRAPDGGRGHASVHRTHRRRRCASGLRRVGRRQDACFCEAAPPT